MSGYRDQKKCDSCGQWLDPLEKCGCLSTTPSPAPAGEREAFEAVYVKVCGYPAATIANFWEPTQQYYMDDGLQSHWLLWNARASSPAPVLELTSEERAIIKSAKDTAEYDHWFVDCAKMAAKGSKIDEDANRLIGLLAIISRLTAPADGENDRLTHEAADARLVELRGNKDWTRRYFAGDKEAIAEYDRLIAAVSARPGSADGEGGR